MAGCPLWVKADILACVGHVRFGPSSSSDKRVAPVLARIINFLSSNDKTRLAPAHCPSPACDLAYVIVRLDRRQLVWINVTQHPTAEWIARQLTEGFPWDVAPRYLIRDQDRLEAMGIRDRPIARGSPWQNGFAERLIGSIRRECLDHVIVVGEAHLRRILRSYCRYYNEIRTHRSLDKDAPLRRPIQSVGTIRSRAILGGLHHHYARV
jgi:transposase InsO family protein